MNSPIIPDSKKVQKTVSELQEVCRKFDVLNLTLDVLIAQVDEEIQSSPLTIYRSKKIREAQST